MADPLAPRRREQAAMVEAARDYVTSLDARVRVLAAAVVGSVARGDFNVWSDVDVVVVAESLPARLPDRSALLLAEAPVGVQPVGFTPAEFLRALETRNRLAHEALDAGVVLAGGEFFAELEARSRA